MVVYLSDKELDYDGIQVCPLLKALEILGYQSHTETVYLHSII